LENRNGIEFGGIVADGFKILWVYPCFLEKCLCTRYGGDDVSDVGGVCMIMIMNISMIMSISMLMIMCTSSYLELDIVSEKGFGYRGYKSVIATTCKM
jgi:hypothetical protein